MRDPTAGAIWTVTARDDVLKSLAECHDRAANGVANSLPDRTSELDRIPLRTMTDLAEREGEALLADQAKWARRVLSFHGWDPDTLLPTPAAEQASHGIVGDGIVHLLTRTGRKRCVPRRWLACENSRSVYALTYKEPRRRLAITASDNGYAVGANPRSLPKENQNIRRVKSSLRTNAIPSGSTTRRGLQGVALSRRGCRATMDSTRGFAPYRSASTRRASIHRQSSATLALPFRKRRRHSHPTRTQPLPNS